MPVTPVGASIVPSFMVCLRFFSLDCIHLLTTSTLDRLPVHLTRSYLNPVHHHHGCYSFLPAVSTSFRDTDLQIINIPFKATIHSTNALIAAVVHLEQAAVITISSRISHRTDTLSPGLATLLVHS